MLSIVTVAMNAQDAILRTLASVALQTDQRYEHLVLDGGSTDDTKKQVQSWTAHSVRLIECLDTGPYDAMNQSLHFTKGDYVIFLNAGDIFASPHAVESIGAALAFNRKIVVGDHIYVDNGKWKYKKCQPLSTTMKELRTGDLSLRWLDGIPCHQSTIYRRDVLEQGFDTAYHIAADHDLLFRTLATDESVYQIPQPISIYYGGGYSAKRFSRCKLEWYDIAKNHSENPRGVHEFYAKSFGFTLPDKKKWLPLSGMHLEEGPYPNHGLDFRFRWTSESVARLVILDGPKGANAVSIRIVGVFGCQTVEVKLLGLNSSTRVKLQEGRDERQLALRVGEGLSYPVCVELQVDSLRGEGAGGRLLGIIVAGAEAVIDPTIKERHLDKDAVSPAAGTGIGKRRILSRLSNRKRALAASPV